jgi:serine/threonine-protein kinase HipA
MAQDLLYWVLAAVDGHGKNFSQFLLPGGSFRLAPAYDVMPSYPLVADIQLEARKLKMAMALTGKSRHYQWTHILHRHWLATAKICRFPTDEMSAVIDDVLERMDEVIDQVTDQLPATVPDAVAGPIFAGMRKARAKMAHSKTGE